MEIFKQKCSAYVLCYRSGRRKYRALCHRKKEGLLPYARIFYSHSENQILLNNILKFIETITSKLGIPVILYTTFECAPPINLKYKVYAEEPISYVYSKNKKS